MPYPAFAKSGVTTVTFSQGSLTPDLIEEEPSQVQSEGEDRSLTVYTLAPAILIHTLSFQDLPASDLTALLAFLRDPLVDYAANTFTYTDSDGNDHTVQYVSRSLQRPRNATGTVAISLQLRERL